jgi:hypothetical protein
VLPALEWRLPRVPHTLHPAGDLVKGNLASRVTMVHMIAAQKMGRRDFRSPHRPAEGA